MQISRVSHSSEKNKRQTSISTQSKETSIYVCNAYAVCYRKFYVKNIGKWENFDIEHIISYNKRMCKFIPPIDIEKILKFGKK